MGITEWKSRFSIICFPFATLKSKEAFIPTNLRCIAVHIFFNSNIIIIITDSVVTLAFMSFYRSSIFNAKLFQFSPPRCLIS
jgi:hypothetical protein